MYQLCAFAALLLAPCDSTIVSCELLHCVATAVRCAECSPGPTLSISATLLQSEAEIPKGANAELRIVIS